MNRCSCYFHSTRWGWKSWWGEGARGRKRRREEGSRWRIFI